MKKTILNLITIFSIVIAIISIGSCSKEDDLINIIEVDVPISIITNTEVDVPFAVSTEETAFPDMPLNLELETRIKEKYPSLSISNLKSAKLSSFSIDLLSSSDEEVLLNKVKSAELWIKTPNNTTGEKIATVENNVSTTSLNFTPFADVELMDYLKSSNASLYLKVKGTEVAVAQMKTRVNSSFTIQVGL